MIQFKENDWTDRRMEGRTEGQTKGRTQGWTDLFYRTLPATAWGPKRIRRVKNSQKINKKTEKTKQRAKTPMSFSIQITSADLAMNGV